MSKPLHELDFTDLYICLSDDGPVSNYSPRPKPGQALGSYPVPEEYQDDINSLAKLVNKEEAKTFSMDFEGMRLRGAKQVIFGGAEWVCLRRFPSEVPNLDRLGFTPEILKTFKSLGKRNGLIVIGGATRAGKTTTAVALLKNFLETHGQVAVTIEDPVEYDLTGKVGERGNCYQVPIHEEEDWAEGVKTALRWAPRFIFLGEVRTPKAASNLLRAATSGHLVICTVHGGSVEETLGAILQIAQAELGDTALTRLADGLCAVIHQQIIGGRPSVFMLQTDPNKPSDPVRTAIRANNLKILGTEISKQEALRRQDTPIEAPPPLAKPSTNRPSVSAPPEKKRGLFGFGG